MFDLDHAVGEWRRQMLAADAASASALEELESHLREEVRQQAHAGLGVEQAFQRAIQRMGSAAVLRQEFEKINETKAAQERRLMQQIVSGFAVLYLLMTVTFVVLKVGSFADITFAQQVVAMGAIAATGLFLFGGRYFKRLLPRITQKILRMTIYTFGIILVLVWLFVFYHLVMTRYELTVSQLVVAILWALVPIAALGAMICALEDAAGRRRLEYV